jgi:hypothetical protein
MPTIKRIAKARQRYEMVPVLDDDGKQKEVPVVNQKTGQPKMAKGNRPVMRKLTVADQSRPLPPRKCDYSACPEPDKNIAIGTPFKCLSIKQQFGGRDLFRHDGCPDWQQWEYSNSLSARISQIQSTVINPGGWEAEDDPKSEAESIAEEIRGLAEEKNEAADNMESGFGHETEQSQELSEIADNLESWADDVANACDSLEFPEADVTPDDEMADAMEAWREEAQQAIQDALDNSPI